ncbi:hypothetical protein LMG23994_06835 [Cupriavidus pinatubonensis]|uniref:Uncharacterized protein n=1 Tax=Cupriavidus pinatubonensis TaxID=248026 RepID=A0ABN7ZSW5_9BURK|nr:hypothetical protein LMG23994_06835 [Cupriavidus pinatubonensis]
MGRPSAHEVTTVQATLVRANYGSRPVGNITASPTACPKLGAYRSLVAARKPWRRARGGPRRSCRCLTAKCVPSWVTPTEAYIREHYHCRSVFSERGRGAEAQWRRPLKGHYAHSCREGFLVGHACRQVTDRMRGVYGHAAARSGQMAASSEICPELGHPRRVSAATVAADALLLDDGARSRGSPSHAHYQSLPQVSWGRTRSATAG